MRSAYLPVIAVDGIVLPVVYLVITDEIAKRGGPPLQVTDRSDENVYQDQKSHAPVQYSAHFNVIPGLLHAVLYR